MVATADPVNPQLSAGWLDYAQHVGFGTDPAGIRSPQDKPRVERAVQYLRGNFWAGESFADLADAQARVEVWCRDRAGMRIHGSTAQRPLEMFTELEAGCLLPVPQARAAGLDPTMRLDTWDELNDHGVGAGGEPVDRGVLIMKNWAVTRPNSPSRQRTALRYNTLTRPSTSVDRG